MHSKDELHQWDELKQNQRAHLEDLLEQHWNPRGDTFSQPEGYSLAGEDVSRSGEALLFAPHWAHNSSSPFGTKDQTENLENMERQNGGMSAGSKSVKTVDNVGKDAGNKVAVGGDGRLLNRTEGNVNEETQSPSQQEDKSKFPNSHSGGSLQTVTENPRHKVRSTEATREIVGSMLRPTKEPNPEPRELGRRRDNETPEEIRSLQEEEEKKAEQEREELLLLHKRLDQEKEMLRQQQMKREEEERQKEKKADSQLHGKHRHHLHTTPTPGDRHNQILHAIPKRQGRCQTF